jgi:uncharacterized protein YdeI (YjbR/CyaY-like superfamily)
LQVKKVFAKNRDEWRSWLKKHHDSAREIWLVFYKKATGIPSVSYPESVEEAICFGWIDGLKKRIDEETYTQRFSPRRRNSRWSPTNIQCAKKLIAAGKMTDAGLKAFEQRKYYPVASLQTRAAEEPSLTPDILRALKKNKKAWKNYNNLAPSHQKRYIQWIAAARREDTRKRRLRETVQALEMNEKPGIK